MTPGPKKKNFSRRGDVYDSKKSKPINPGGQAVETPHINIDKPSNESVAGQEEKYGKRGISRNWTKYEEPVSDPHADTMRGKDFEVLSSYSGGSESQLQLQDEKDWDEAVGDKSITIDFQDLINVVKSIPFHKRINLPEDIFDDAQLSKFAAAAEMFRNASYEIKSNAPVIPQKKLEDKEYLDPKLNIIESYESEEIVDDVSTKPFTLEVKTENLIESLASCMSLKSIVQEKARPDAEIENEKHSSNVPDDLDFLLSLSISSNNTKQEAKSSTQKQTNVDDWLNSILDD